MKETICTIPINDIFGEKKGCPFCRMYDMLDQIYCEFVTGSAMMDPETRVQTNKKGFCPTHFSRINEVGKRLPNALILQTHLDEIKKNFFSQKPNTKPDKKKLLELNTLLHTCYVCDRIDHDFDNFLKTVFVEWQQNPEFRKLYQSQEFICLEHYRRVSETALKGVPSKFLADFHADTFSLTEKYLSLLIDDTTHFCKMFDYQSRGLDWGNSRDAIERDLTFLARVKKPSEAEDKTPDKR